MAGMGELHDAFTKAIDGRAAQAKTHHDAARGDGVRDWNGPAEVTDPLDVAGITKGFDRTKINDNFERAVADADEPGTVGDVVALKVQCDVLGVMERAYRARHCTPVRLIGMMAARRLGHAHERGVFKGGVLGYVQGALKEGKS